MNRADDRGALRVDARAAAATPDAVDDGLTSSTNALTQKLYLTVLDVFGNHNDNDVSDEEEYAKMLETLRDPQRPKKRAPAPCADGGDTRGVIARKLREGYALEPGRVCDACVMPLMSFRGRVVCVVCDRLDAADADRVTATEGPAKGVASAGDATNDSSANDEARDVLVDKALSQFHDRRTQATHTYTAKLLDGYTMHNSLCAECDMPMMKKNGLVECVVCPDEEAVEEASGAVAVFKALSSGISDSGAAARRDTAQDDSAVVKDVARAPPADASKPAKKLSPAEIIAERLRCKNSCDCDAKTDNELEKAEAALVDLVETLGVGKQSGALQEYFLKKRQDRTAMKRLKEAEDGILEAEAVACLEERLREQHRRQEVAPRAARAEEPSDGREHSAVKRSDQLGHRYVPEHGAVNKSGRSRHRHGPATPQVPSRMGCSIGDSVFFPSLRKWFASAPDPSFSSNRPNTRSGTHRTDSRTEARTRIAALVAEGWEVSAESCPSCELALFSKTNKQQTLQHCVMCGPIAKNDTAAQQGDSHKKQKEAQEAITQKMIGRIIEGWSIADDTPCAQCGIPTMLNPKTQRKHCIACEVLMGSEVPLASTQQLSIGKFTEGGQTAIVGSTHAQESTDVSKQEADTTTKMVNRIMEGWSVVEGSQCPSCSQPLMYEPKTRLTHCVACGVLTPTRGGATDPMSENIDPNPYGIDLSPPKQEIHNKLKVETGRVTFNAPDPTTSMLEFRGKAGDPDGVLKNKVHVAPEFEQGHYNPAIIKAQLMTTGPTTNMQAQRNKLCGDGPTPNVLANWSKLYLSGPSENTQFKACDPTPSMQTNRNKLVSLSPHCLTELAGDASNQSESGNSAMPAMRTLRHKNNEPTPNMQSAWNKLNESGYRASMYTMQGKVDVANIHSVKITGAEPTPSNFHSR